MIVPREGILHFYLDMSRLCERMGLSTLASARDVAGCLTLVPACFSPMSYVVRVVLEESRCRWVTSRTTAMEHTPSFNGTEKWLSEDSDVRIVEWVER